MPTKKKPTVRKTERKPTLRRGPSRGNVEGELALELVSASSRWSNYFRSLPASSPLKPRARATANVLKALVDAYTLGDVATLDELELLAKRSLRHNSFAARSERGEDPDVDLSRFGKRWIHQLGPILASKNDGRAEAVHANVESLRWKHENGRLNEDAFVTGTELLLTSAFVDTDDLLPSADALRAQARDANTSEIDVLRRRARNAFKNWEQGARTDFEKLFRSGLRAFGVPKDKAANVLKALDMQAKRRSRQNE